MKQRNYKKKKLKYVDKLKILRDVYKQIPPFECLPNCGTNCCGPMPVYPFEYRVINNYIKKHNLDIHIMLPLEHMALLKAMRDKPEIKETLKYCEALDQETGRCRIYPVRAFICRIFGSVPENPWNPGVSLLCSNKKPKYLLSPEKARRLGNIIAAL